MQRRTQTAENPTFGWPANRAASHVYFDPPEMALRWAPDDDDDKPWYFDGDHHYQNTVFQYRVAAGARTDLASVPRIARLWCNPNGRWQRAAAFHDAAYSTQDCDRFDADAMFRAIMHRDGCGALRAFWMYAAVRVFGGYAWRKNARRLAAQIDLDRELAALRRRSIDYGEAT